MIYFSIFNNYPLIAIIAFVFILFIFLDNIYIPKKKRKKIDELIKKLATQHNYHLNVPKNSIYDYVLKNEKKVTYIKYIIVPEHSAITVNSKNTWKLSYGGSPNRLGKSYPHQRYLNEMIKFLDFKPNDDEPTLKLVVVYPRTNKVQKYLNESEIVIIKTGDLVYDYKVITYNELESHFLSLTN